VGDRAEADEIDGVRAALRVLADLAPSGEQRAGGLSIPTEWFRWLPVSVAPLLLHPPAQPLPFMREPPPAKTAKGAAGGRPLPS
jgi:hypothetical protein